MGIMKIFRNPIWDTIESANAWLIRTRVGDLAISAQERTGINFSILLNSACYVEGSLEWLLHQLLDDHSQLFHSIDKPDLVARRTVNRFFRRLMEDIEKRICRATGPENYGDVFELLVGKPLSECAGDAESWEGIRVLFYLRNAIAHGRMAAAKYTMVGGTPEQPEWDEEFNGGYARVCEYLEKRGLASGKFGDLGVETLVFCDQVADHFWSLAQTVTQTVIKTAEADFTPRAPTNAE
jgi:hypothetical protein